MTSVVNNYHIRHGHMVNINREISSKACLPIFVKVDALSHVWSNAHVKPAYYV